MKILFANWSWYATGGDWTYIQNVMKLYESNGYEVIPISTINPKNVASPYAEYFVKSYDFNKLNQHKSIKNGIRVLKTSVVSKDALKKLAKVLDYKIIADELFGIDKRFNKEIEKRLDEFRSFRDSIMKDEEIDVTIFKELITAIDNYGEETSIIINRELAQLKALKNFSI